MKQLKSDGLLYAFGKAYDGAGFVDKRWRMKTGGLDDCFGMMPRQAIQCG